jgi:hypothetical protein
MNPCRFSKRKHEMIKGAEYHIFRSEKILGTKQEFCQSFYHIRETPECDQLEECLDDHHCSPKVCIALVTIGDYCARYSNCADRMHAEDYMLLDKSLLLKIRESQNCTLTCYLTLQPCHFSSNRADKSCTLRLISFYQTFLQPNNIQFDLVIGYPYRTHWEILCKEEQERYGQSIKNGKIGFQLLSKHIHVRAFNENDWTTLSLHCQDPIVISQNRLKMDTFTQSIINTYS